MIFALADMTGVTLGDAKSYAEMFNTIKSIRYGEIFDSRQ
jgi:hypothetical protein